MPLNIGAAVAVGLAVVLALVETPGSYWRFWNLWSRRACLLGAAGLAVVYGASAIIGWLTVDHYEHELVSEHPAWAGLVAFGAGQLLFRASAAPIKPDGADHAFSLLRLAKQWIVDGLDGLAQNRAFDAVRQASDASVVNLTKSVVELHVVRSQLDSAAQAQVVSSLNEILASMIAKDPGSRGRLDGFCARLVREWRVPHRPQM